MTENVMSLIIFSTLFFFIQLSTMSLVEYSDSDSDDDEVDINTNNSIRDNDDSDGDEKLQPPAKFLQLYKTNPKLSPNPAFHQGKTRSIAHIDGSWPCFVSLEWDLTKKQLTQLDSTLKSVEIEINQPIHRLFYSELHVPQPLHVSLTSTLMIRQEDLKEFEAEIIRSIKQTKSGTDQLEISFESIAVLSNETKTRSFVVMVIDPESSSKVSINFFFF